MTFSEKLKYLRKKRGLTQTELATLANVTQGAIWNYEKGRSLPVRNTQLQIAKVLGVKVDDLMVEGRSVE